MVEGKIDTTFKDESICEVTGSENDAVNLAASVHANTGPEFKIVINVPWYKRLKWALVDFIHIATGSQHCINCKRVVDYECEYCYTRKKLFKRTVKTKFVPVEGCGDWLKNLKRAFVSLYVSFKVYREEMKR